MPLVRYAFRLAKEIIRTAADRATASVDGIRARNSVTLSHFEQELRGIPCGELEEPDRKQIVVSRRLVGMSLTLSTH